MKPSLLLKENQPVSSQAKRKTAGRLRASTGAHTYLLGLGEGVVGGQRQTQHVLVGVDDGVGHGCQGGVAGGQGQGSHVCNTCV
jgi:hypothetical protein